MTSSGGHERPRSSLADAESQRAILTQAEELGHVGAWAWQVDTGESWWSDEGYRILGLDPGEQDAGYAAFVERIHPDDREAVERAIQAALGDTEPMEMRHRIVRPTGEVRHVLERVHVARAPDGSAERLIGICRDVTDEAGLEQERDAALRALADSEERHRLLAENAWDVVWTMALDGTITYVSPSVQRVRGLTPEEAAAQTLDQIHPPESAAKTMQYYADLFAAIEAGTELPTFRGEMEYYRKDGSIMHGELQVIPHVDADGNVVQILGVTRDVSERRQAEDELNRLAVTDPLTGVWNRRHGALLMTDDLVEARRYGPPLSLLMLDIDHFKAINDSLGHQAGDRVLIELCHRLADGLRASDVLSRWGGEEFVILVRHCTLDQAVALADKLRRAVSATPFSEVGRVTVSIGVAQLGPDDDLASWMARADRALYAAKAAGRDAVAAES